MKHATFARLVETHGAKVGRWPPLRRVAAIALLVTSARARAEWRRARCLEDTLDTLTVPAFTGLERRVLDQPLPRQPQATADTPAATGLEQRVLDQPLPQRPRAEADTPPASRPRAAWVEGFIDWLLPPGDGAAGWRRSAAAACLPLLVGIAVGNFYSFGVEFQADGMPGEVEAGVGAELGADTWWDDELYALALGEHPEAAG